MALISTSAAAPSLMPQALPAVTVPSLVKAGRRPAIASIVAPSRIYSSLSTTVSPLRPFTVTGDDLVLEAAGLLGGFRLVLRGHGETVLLLAGDLPLLATFSAVMPM